DEGDPERVMFFKDWARSDGYPALSVFMEKGRNGKPQCILSVTPASRTTLQGLGARLDEAEASKRRALNRGLDDREVDPKTGKRREPRQGYRNADPWYDGRAHGYTIVDSPTGGTVLTAEEIEEVFLRLGGDAAAMPLGAAPAPAV